MSAAPEPLDQDVLFVAATRPALVFGLPIGLAVALMMLAVLLLIIIQNPFYEIIMVPLYVVSRLAVRYDYNGVRIVSLWVQTKARAIEARHWGGASPPVFPTKSRPGRGMKHGI
jgi:type IV secretion system protein VirB3